MSLGQNSRSAGPAALRDHAVFKSLSDSHLQELIECSKILELKKGDILFTTGKRADGFYLIQSGRICLQLYTEERGPQEIQSMSSGDLIGWSWLIPPNTWQYDARAVADSTVYFFDGYDIKKKFEADHELRAEILERFVSAIGDRLVAARKKILELYHAKT